MSTKLNEMENHEDFRVVWFSLDDNLPNKLTHITEYLEKCDSFRTCEHYIKGFRSERKILLVLVDMLEHLPYFNNLAQIQSIYILERSIQNTECDKQKYSKLVNVFKDDNTLVEQIRRDILLTYRSDLSITISCLDEIKIEQSFMSLDKNTFELLWNQLFIHRLVNSSGVDMNKLKEDMIEQCRLEYNTKTGQFGCIENFAVDCRLDNVINWYTQDSFVYRLINKAFRKRNVDLICKFRYTVECKSFYPQCFKCLLK